MSNVVQFPGGALPRFKSLGVANRTLVISDNVGRTWSYQFTESQVKMLLPLPQTILLRTIYWYIRSYQLCDVWTDEELDTGLYLDPNATLDGVGFAY